MQNSQIFAWNVRFPSDRRYRQKYQIGFMSKEHRKLNPIDMHHDITEDHYYNELSQEIKTDRKNHELYSKGNWMQEREYNGTGADDPFDQDINDFNDMLNGL